MQTLSNPRLSRKIAPPTGRVLKVLHIAHAWEEGRARSHANPMRPNRRHGTQAPTEASRTNPHISGVDHPNFLANNSRKASSADAGFASRTASPDVLGASRSARPRGPNPRTARRPKGRRREEPPPNPISLWRTSPSRQPPTMGGSVDDPALSRTARPLCRVRGGKRPGVLQTDGGQLGIAAGAGELETATTIAKRSSRPVAKRSSRPIAKGSYRGDHAQPRPQKSPRKGAGLQQPQNWGQRLTGSAEGR
jgi:hypothetical protein